MNLPAGIAPCVAVIGGGPAGLMAAEVLAQGGARVDLFDAMPSVGRKFLLAGKGGLNLTHIEPLDTFVGRYGERRAQVARWLERFGPAELRAWAQGLGIDTFVGSSGRVFPADMKAAPLLRAWLHRLRNAGVRFHMRHRWIGSGDVDAKALRFSAPQGVLEVRTDAVVLALGGGSWPRLGSDGEWVPLLKERGVDVAALKPSNCGFDGAAWSDHFRSRHAGQPVKSAAIAFTSTDGSVFRQPGEFVVTETGVEGSLIYAASARLRDAIETLGSATLHIDLLPARAVQWVAAELAPPRGPRSMPTHLKTRLGLHGVKAGLLYELLPKHVLAQPAELAGAIKALPLRLLRARPLDESISTAGGVSFDALDESLMLRSLSGVHCAGEMIDWEAPTGGYLLTACFASGRIAGLGVLAGLHARRA